MIASRPVKDLAAKDCVLFLWTTNQHLDFAMSALKAWSFTYKSLYVWDKVSMASSADVNAVPNPNLGVWDFSFTSLK